MKMLMPPGHPCYFVWSIEAPDGKGPGTWITSLDDPLLKEKPYKFGGCSVEDPVFVEGFVIADPEDFTRLSIVQESDYPVLWLPLPEEHPRMQLWLQAVYRYFYNWKEPAPDEYVRRYCPQHQTCEHWVKQKPEMVETEWWTSLSTGPLTPEQAPVQNYWWLRKMGSDSRKE